MPDFITANIPLLISAATNVLLALAIVFIGLKLLRTLNKFLKKALLDKFDPSVTRFIASLVVNILKILLFITALGIVGVETTSFLALIGAAGIALGAALAGTLQNFASGVLIILNHPYKVGDVVEIADVKGTVDEIEIFNTILKTPDNNTKIIPNKIVLDGIITNHSEEPLRRVDMVIGVGYGADLNQVKAVIKQALDSHPLVVKEKLAIIEATALNESSVDFLVAPWVKQEDYVPALTTLTQPIKEALDNANIEIPFPQRVIHSSNN